MSLSATQHRLLLAIANGSFLKAHRDLEGHKLYQLHPLQGEPQPMSGEDVQYLVDQGLIDSNKKFPAATFWLTEKGKAMLKASEVAQTAKNSGV
jgi:hypothetical protein